jgi:hypothetical protein
LRRSIDDGLSRSRFGIVIISPSFLDKEWPQRELDGMVAKEIDGKKVVLPVWHNVTRRQVAEGSPTLVDRIAANTSNGQDSVVAALLQVLREEQKDA